MQRSAQEETHLLMKYDPLLKSMARKFQLTSRQYDQGRTEFEDLYQSARLAFVELLRTDGFDPDLCGWDIRLTKALYDCSLSNALVHIPRGAYASKGAQYRASSLDASEDLLDALSNDPYADVDTAIDAQQWAANLSPYQSKVVQLILEGATWDTLLKQGVIKSSGHSCHVRRALLRAYLGLGQPWEATRPRGCAHLSGGHAARRGCAHPGGIHPSGRGCAAPCRP